jgi:predicted hotdog family 3-hydroxylacyl-ACP dehydratase
MTVGKEIDGLLPVDLQQHVARRHDQRGGKNAMEPQSTRAAVHLPLPQPAIMLLPHKPPMLLVETLVERQGSRTLAMATLPTSGIFVAGGHILPEYFIELIAQTAALGNCYDALTSGMAVRDGMLVGIDTFSWFGQPQPGASVQMKTEVTFEFDTMKVIHGEVSAGQQLLAMGEIKVWT